MGFTKDDAESAARQVYTTPEDAKDLADLLTNLEFLNDDLLLRHRVKADDTPAVIVGAVRRLVELGLVQPGQAGPTQDQQAARYGGSNREMQELQNRVFQLELHNNKSSTTTQQEKEIGSKHMQRAGNEITMMRWHDGASVPLPVPLLSYAQHTSAIEAIKNLFPRQLTGEVMSLTEAAVAKKRELRNKRRRSSAVGNPQPMDVQPQAMNNQQQDEEFLTANHDQQQDEGALIENLHMQPAAVALIEALVGALQPAGQPGLFVVDTHAMGLRPGPLDGKIDCSILAKTKSPLWAYLGFMAEFKLHGSDMVGAVGQLCQRARLVFHYQSSRRYIYGVAITLSELRVVLFQRGVGGTMTLQLSPLLAMGVGSSNGLCSTTELAPGVLALARLSACNPGQLGWDAEQQPAFDRLCEGKQFELGVLLGSGSRATAHPSSVYKALWGGKEVAAKFYSNARELEALRHITDRGGHLHHVVKLEHYQEMPRSTTQPLDEPFYRLLLSPVCSLLNDKTPLRTLAQVTLDITDAIEFCISQGVYSRDISLYNIGVFNGRGYMFDLSASKMGAQAKSEGGAPWAVTGTPVFISHRLLLNHLAHTEYLHDIHTHLESLYLSVRYAVMGGLPYEWVYQQFHSMEKWEAVRAGYMARRQVFGEEVDAEKVQFLQQLHSLWYREVPAQPEAAFVYQHNVTAADVRAVCQQVLGGQ